MVGRDDKIIMLSLMQGSRGGSNRTHKTEAIDTYLWVDDIDALHAEFRQNGVDLDGYVLCFGEDVPG